MTVRPYRLKTGETRWQYTVELPRGLDGRRWQEHRRGYPDKAAAETAELEARLRVLKGGSRPDPARMTVADLLDEWLAAVAPTVKPATSRNYRQSVAHLKAELGPVPIADFKGLHVQRAERDLARRFAPTTLSLLHVVLNAALARAVDWDMIPRNPARNVARPPRRRRREPTPWTAEQAAAFPPSPTPPPTAPSGGSCSTPAVASARHSPSAGTTWTSTPAPFASAAP